MPLRVMLPGALPITLCNLSVARKPKVVNIPARRTSANAGKETDAACCAACHRKDGKGDGPVAAALKARLAHFLILARQNERKFPTLRVAQAITGEAGISAHGSKQMPIWGPVFMSMSHQHESGVRLQVANLTQHIKSLQQK